MNFRMLIISSVLAFMLVGCKTTDLKSSTDPVKVDLYRVWIEPSYAKSLRKLNGRAVRYQTIEIPKPSSLAVKEHHGED